MPLLLEQNYVKTPSVDDAYAVVANSLTSHIPSALSVSWHKSTVRVRISVHAAGRGASALRYNVSSLKVSQAAISPRAKPCLNQATRCCEEPWVKESGTT